MFAMGFFVSGGLAVLPMLLLFLHYPNEDKDPNFNRWLGVYLCCYFGLYFASYYTCDPHASGLEIIISLFWGPIIVGDFVLGSVGLIEWGSGVLPSCFQ